MPPRVPHRTPGVRPSAERELIPTFIEFDDIQKRRTTVIVTQGCSVNRVGRVMSRMVCVFCKP